MKMVSLLLLLSLLFNSCSPKSDNVQEPLTEEQEEVIPMDTIEKPIEIKIEIEKELLYDKHTLADTYPYKDTTREFQWDKIKDRLYLVDSLQTGKSSWAILQNYKNMNGEAPLVKEYERNAYKRIADMYGVERYQSVPLFSLDDSSAPERYGSDGTLVKLTNTGDSIDNTVNVEAIYFEGEWSVPKKYIKQINDTVVFKKVVCIDLTNQNIATLEKVGSKWLVRSMNPATTGLHKPPHMQETPQGLFVIQEKKSKMIYLVDGSQETGGFAPYASRFSDGGYIHGVPVNAPKTDLIEFSPTLGTIPRSHMCVRNATSHAKFIYDWGPSQETLVFIFD